MAHKGPVDLAVALIRKLTELIDKEDHVESLLRRYQHGYKSDGSDRSWTKRLFVRISFNVVCQLS